MFSGARVLLRPYVGKTRQRNVHKLEITPFSFQVAKEMTFKSLRNEFCWNPKRSFSSLSSEDQKKMIAEDIAQLKVEIKQVKEQIIQVNATLRNTQGTVQILSLQDKGRKELKIMQEQPFEVPECFLNSEIRNPSFPWMERVKEVETDFFNDMENAEVKSYGEGIKIISMRRSFIFPFEDISEENNVEIFVRSFYNDLYEEIRLVRRVILTGNPGIGKSWFQWYLLYRWINETDPTKKPRVVIREAGEEFSFFFLQEKKYFVLKDPFLPIMLKYFNPENTIYLFDPIQLKSTVHYDHGLPIIASVYPDITLYKEFEKNGGKKLYMPCWNLEELLEVGKNKLIGNSNFYSEEKIKERFFEFGGIFRHVIPKSEYSYETYKTNQENAIKRCSSLNWHTLFNSSIELDDRNQLHPISDFIKQFRVKNLQKGGFSRAELDWASDYVREKVFEIINSFDYHLKIQILLWMFSGFVEYNSLLFENVVADAATRYQFKVSKLLFQTNIGADASHRNELAKEETGIKNLQNSEEKMMLNELPKFDRVDLLDGKKFEELEENVLYRPSSQEFPAVDFVFKWERQFCALQVTNSQEHAKEHTGTIKQLRNKLGVTENFPCSIFIITKPENIAIYESSKGSLSSTYYEDNDDP